MDSQFTSKLKSLQSRLEVSNGDIQRDAIYKIASLLFDKTNTTNTVRIDHLLQLLENLLLKNTSLQVLEATLQTLSNAVITLTPGRYDRVRLVNRLVDNIMAIRTNVGVDGVELAIQHILRQVLQVDYMEGLLNSQQQTTTSTVYNPLLSLIKNQEVLASLVNNIERSLLDDDARALPSILDKRWAVMLPCIASILIGGVSRDVSQHLHNTLVRIAHNSATLYPHIINSLTLLQYYGDNGASSLTPASLPMLYDLIDLLRYPPQGMTIDLEVPRLRLAVFLAQSLVTSTGLHNSLLQLLQDTLATDTSKNAWQLLWHATTSPTSTVLNCPLIVTLAYMLPRLPLRSDQATLLRIIQTALSKASTDPSHATLHMLIYPLLILQSTTSLFDTLDKLAKDLRTDIEVRIAKLQVVVGSVPSTLQSIGAATSHSTSMLNVSFDWYSQLINKTSSSSLDSFFDSLERKLEARQDRPADQPTGDLDLLIFSLAPLAHHGTSSETRRRAIRALAILPSIDTIHAIRLLPLFMNRLQHEESGQVVMELYRALPELARHRVCYPVVVKALSDLATRKATMPIALRLLAKVWLINDKVMPKLQELLINIKPEQSSVEERVAAAATIRDVCEHDEDAGQELIQPLSGFLCRDEHPSVISLALEALIALCSAEVLSFTSAWNVIKKNLGAEEGFEQGKRHPLVLQRLANFFQNGVHGLKDTPLATMDEKKADTIRDIVRRVWHLSRHANAEVASTAYQVLAAYAEIDNTIIIPQADIPTLGNLLINQQIGVRNIDLMLKCSLESELNERRTLKSAHTNLRSTKSIRIAESLGGVADQLYQEFQKESRVGIRQGVISGLLWSFNNAVSLGQDLGPQKKETKKMIALRYKAFATLLPELVECVDNGSSARGNDFFGRLLSMGAWRRFMGECFVAFQKYESTKVSLASKESTKDSTDTSSVSKQLIETVYNQLQQVLVQAMSKASSLQVMENCVLAMVGLAQSMPQTAYIQVENTMSHLFQCINDKLVDQRFKSPIYLGMAMLTSSLLDDSALLVRSVDTLLSYTPAASDTVARYTKQLAIGIAALTLSSSASFSSSIHKKDNVKQLIEYQMSQLKTLKVDAFKEDDEAQEQIGLVLALGYSVGAFEAMGDFASLKIVLDTLQTLMDNEATIAKQTPQLFGVVLLTIASTLRTCVKVNLINVDRIETMLDRLNTLRNTYRSHKHLSIFSTAAHSLFVQYLACQFYNIDVEVVEQLLREYQSKDGLCSDSMTERISALVGVSILIGSPLLAQDKDFACGALYGGTLQLVNSYPARRKECQQSIQQIIVLVNNIFSNDQDSKVIRYAALCLGTLSLPPSGNQSASSSMSDTPENLDHLGDDTLVKMLFNLVRSPTSTDTQVGTALSVLTKVDGTRLPIVNWGSVLKRLFASSQNEDIRANCIEFSSKNIELSTCSINLAEWTNLAQFRTNSSLVKRKLIQSIPAILPHLSATRIESTLNELLGGIARRTLTISDSLTNDAQIVWRVLAECNRSATVKEQVTKLIFELFDTLPAPFTMDHEALMLNKDNLCVLDTAIDTLAAIPLQTITQHITFPMHSDKQMEKFSKEFRNVYVLSALQQRANTNEFHRIKSWCFSVVDLEKQAVVFQLLPNILVNALVKTPLVPVIKDILASLSISKTIVGVEILAQIVVASASFDADCDLQFVLCVLGQQGLRTSILLPHLMPLLVQSIGLKSTDLTDLVSLLHSNSKDALARRRGKDRVSCDPHSSSKKKCPPDCPGRHAHPQRAPMGNSHIFVLDSLTNQCSQCRLNPKNREHQKKALEEKVNGIIIRTIIANSTVTHVSVADQVWIFNKLMSK
ncbi:hypothetical protein SAMD00019534_042330 [Acytostelium subglobosum LB1]|uniref:hypothetical protein n=1 Tax=Acytostelium subglobosum LB1 TaxID=1410327 RepID=UPI000644D157|nr:hypothetical protein SAMD00019534_042330 [Acytostelium subglobosum LB1]GAM21058.1 hypothetical protein SAMD00019534_042330 [Acytostelium subglobosum LB1]|eukprot:XP_012756192.1 hypothetical protein SAMD00019534_042330 [Acytostelium subglobosum LB1]